MKNCQNLNSIFELVSRIVKLNLLTRQPTKTQHGSSANFLIIYLNKTIRLPW
jgi:hypothetical protein